MKLVFVMFFILIFISSISAFDKSEFDFDYPDAPTNFSAQDTNSSNFWDLLDDPTDIILTTINNDCDGGEFYDGEGLGVCVSFNDSVKRLFAEEQVVYNATSITTTGGTYTDGDLDSIKTLGDGESYNVTEDTGADPIIININFTGIVNFNTFALRGQYSGGASHHIAVEILRVGGDWEIREEITDQMTFGVTTFPVFIGSDFIDSGLVQIRLRHEENGVASHNYKLDAIFIGQVTGLVSGGDLGDLTGRQDACSLLPTVFCADGTTNMTGNLNASGYNISADTYFGDGSQLAGVALYQFTDNNFNGTGDINASRLFLVGGGGEPQLTLVDGGGNVLTIEKIVGGGTEYDNKDTGVHLFQQSIFSFNDITTVDDLTVQGGDLAVSLGTITSGGRIFADGGITGGGLLTDGGDSNIFNGNLQAYSLSDSGFGSAGQFFLYKHSTDDIEDTFATNIVNRIGNDTHAPGNIGKISFEIDGCYNCGGYEYKAWDSGSGANALEISAIGSVFMPEIYNDDLVGSAGLRDVQMNTTGQLGYTSSSERYKENIVNLSSQDSSWIYNLSPKKYDRKDGSRIGEIGLVAEDVALVNEDLVTYVRNITYDYYCQNEFTGERLEGDYEKMRNDNNPDTECYSDVISISKTNEVETVEYSRPELITTMIAEIQRLNDRIAVLEGQ